uniref:Kinesin motor domain-containing protein n=1 Tax=Macrostomum lignano TaxID=282301 RepID=A0A1I8FJV3_9PLAT
WTHHPEAELENAGSTLTQPLNRSNIQHRLPISAGEQVENRRRQTEPQRRTPTCAPRTTASKRSPNHDARQRRLKTRPPHTAPPTARLKRSPHGRPPTAPPTTPQRKRPPTMPSNEHPTEHPTGAPNGALPTEHPTEAPTTEHPTEHPRRAPTKRPNGSTPTDPQWAPPTTPRNAAPTNTPQTHSAKRKVSSSTRGRVAMKDKKRTAPSRSRGGRPHHHSLHRQHNAAAAHEPAILGGFAELLQTRLAAPAAPVTKTKTRARFTGMQDEEATAPGSPCDSTRVACIVAPVGQAASPVIDASAAATGDGSFASGLRTQFTLTRWCTALSSEEHLMRLGDQQAAAASVSVVRRRYGQRRGPQAAEAIGGKWRSELACGQDGSRD